MASEPIGSESEWLDRRMGFLLDRARVHEKEEGVLARACAGTLLRDAAAIAFMRKDPRSGRAHLDRAGKHFRALGLPHGVLLTMLASDGRPDVESLQRMLRAALQKPGSESRAGPDMGPLFASALHQPEQLIALQCAMAMAEATGGFEGQMEELMRGRLHPYRSHPIGMSRVSVGAFMRLLDFGRGVETADLETFGNQRLDMMTLFARRGRQLASAYEDNYHWRLLLSPAALVDFDLVGLFAVWSAHGRSIGEMMPQMGERLPPMMMLPVTVAQSLGPRRRGLTED